MAEWDRVRRWAPVEVWTDALRMAVASVAAFAATEALGLHSGAFAVLMALMVVRPTGSGGVSVVLDRLAGMALGIAVGLVLVVALGRSGLPQVLLVALAMLPLCFVVAKFRKYQAAPMAAIIVLSASLALRVALHAALLRVAEIVLGAFIGFVVAAIVLRRTIDQRSRQHAANVLTGCGELVAAAAVSGKAARDDRLRARIRTDLRLVMATSKVLREKGKPISPARITGLLRLQADVQSFGRAVLDMRRPLRMQAQPVLAAIAAAFDDLCRETAAYLLKDVPPPDFADFDATVLALRGAAPGRTAPRPDDASLALPYLLTRLRADLADLIAGYAPPPEAEPEDPLIEADAPPALALAPP